MQRHADRTCRLAENRGDCRRVQASKHPKCYRLSLVRWQRRDQPDRLTRGKRVEYLVLNQVMIGNGVYRLWHRNCRPALSSAGVIYSPVPAYGKQPAPKVFFTADEARQVAYYLQPGLAGNIFGIFTAKHSQVTQQTGLELSPQLEKARFVT